jgi:hypothetical protein
MVLRPETMRKPVEHVPAQSTGDTHTGLHATPAPAAPAAHPVDPVTAPGPAASPAATPAAPKGGGIGAIQILTGANAGKELELTKNLTTLGKPGVQVAVITRRPHGFFITHVEGANFPVVNGQAIDAHPRELKDHDVIELVGVKMEFFLKT